MKKLLVLLLVLSLGISSLAFAESTETVILHGVLENKPAAIESPLAYLCAVRALKIMDAFFMGDISGMDVQAELEYLSEICPYEMEVEIRSSIHRIQHNLAYLHQGGDLFQEIIDSYDSLYRAVHGL